jgi:MFS family permease
MTYTNFFSKETITATASYNRWLVPPAALCIHLCIGQIYAYSVFNNPLTHLLGRTEPTPQDWNLKTVGWIFSIALFFLGASSATFGKWVERVGPRLTMFVSALCFCGGFLIAALGVHLHQIWLLYVGNGVLGGIGLGLGYISPVSTLIKWFPDRPGMATGMAIMGFGGGAMIGSPLAVWLMHYFQTPDSAGVKETMIVMGFLYFILILFGAWIVRIPPPGWQPLNTNIKHKTSLASQNLTVDQAIRTPQFYLLFGVLMLNVTAGIGVLGQASVMIQEMFSPASMGDQHAVTEVAAAGFVGLLSLFNMIGRFFWSSLSDWIGRKWTYALFFALGSVLYFLVPLSGHHHNLVLFVGLFCVILTMYGGGFATIPAYLKDLFGDKQVGAIHGRLLLAWSMAALLGPILVNYIRSYQIEVLHVLKADAYSTTMYIMSGLLVIGFILNMLIRPVHKRFFTNPLNEQT